MTATDPITMNAEIRRLIESYKPAVKGLADLTGMTALRLGFTLCARTDGSTTLAIQRTDATSGPGITALEADDIDRMEAKLQDLARLQHAIAATITHTLNEKGTHRAA